MPESPNFLRAPLRASAGILLGIGSLAFTAEAVEGNYDGGVVEVEADATDRVFAASVGKPIVSELCLQNILQQEIGEDCVAESVLELPETPEVTVSSLEEIEEELKKVLPTTTTTTTPPPPHTTTTTSPPPPPAPVSGSKVEWMNQAGIAPADQGYTDYIVTDESKWDPGAVSPNQCIGLGQNCKDKYGNYWLDDACPNWQQDPVCQLRRFATYAIERYGSWEDAYEFKKREGWW